MGDAAVQGSLKTPEVEHQGPYLQAGQLVDTGKQLLDMRHLGHAVGPHQGAHLKTADSRLDQRLQQT